MSLPSSGVMKASMIMQELKQSSGPWSINSKTSRDLAKVPSGTIRFSDFYGKSNFEYTLLVGYTASWNNVGYHGFLSQGSLTPNKLNEKTLISCCSVSLSNGYKFNVIDDSFKYIVCQVIFDNALQIISDSSDSPSLDQTKSKQVYDYLMSKVGQNIKLNIIAIKESTTKL